MLPPLPTKAFSLLGPIAVGSLDEERARKEELFGRFDGGERCIEIAEGLTPEGEWATYWHEVTHVALFDMGANNILTEEQIETVCDVMGTYMTAMMRAGMLSVPAPDHRHDPK